VPNSSMLNRDHTIAIYMEGSLRSLHGKMGFGIMRYFPGQIACIIDSTFAGRRIDEVITSPCEAPIVATIEEACTLGAQVLVLGTAPSGGRIPPEWLGSLETAINNGLSIVNGMHDRLKDRFGTLESEDQWIWDIRHPESFVPSIASGRARTLTNKRVLLTGTDMAVGKMTTGLEIYHWLLAKEQSTVFLATGQIGMAITGNGIPLDAFKVDHACGAVEEMVVGAAGYDIVLIEGQGSLLHPASTATLPLMRGSCPTHLVLCHRANATMLDTCKGVHIPPLKEVIALNESLAGAAGALTPATTIGIALNTSRLEEHAAQKAIAELEDEAGLPVEDVVRFGAGKLASQLAN